ncbi:hypothetical protein CIB84_012899, partial [Bambusicola thoracicus]
MREEMEMILSEKLAVLQRQLEMNQQAIPPMKEITNTSTSLQKISENIQVLQKGRTVELITSVAMQSMREEMEKILSEKLAVLQRQLEMSQQAIPPMKEMTNTSTSLQNISENMQALQKGLENLQVSTEKDLQMLRADLKGSFIEQRYK